MPSQAEATPIETPISSSQCSWYLPMGMVASMICWKKFCDASVAATRVFMRGVRPLGFVVLLGRTPGTCTTGGPGVDRPPAHPSYVLPTIRTFTVGPGVPPGQPAAGCGRVADCHRRLGVSPTPEHVPCQYAAAAARCPEGVFAVRSLTRETARGPRGAGRRCCTVCVLQPTPDRFRGLARSSPWRWRALAFDLHRRPVHGPEHTVHATVERGVGLEVRLADGERHRDAADAHPRRVERGRHRAARHPRAAVRLGAARRGRRRRVRRAAAGRGRRARTRSGRTTSGWRCSTRSSSPTACPATRARLGPGCRAPGRAGRAPPRRGGAARARHVVGRGGPREEYAPRARAARCSSVGSARISDRRR